jgi:hypothetical protein
MNYREKKTFVSELISNIRRDIIAKLPDTPAEWDGHELRKYTAERFAQADWIMTGKRLRNYKNEVLVRNL